MIASGTSYADIAAWLRGKGAPISRNALARHGVHVGEGPRLPGPRPMSDDLLTAIRDRVYERLRDGDVEPGVKDGLSAQSLLDRRAAEFRDRDLMLRIALALTGTVKVIDPEVEAIEAEFRPLLGDGTAEPEPVPSRRERVQASRIT
jgi:hypothetical protein